MFLAEIMKSIIAACLVMDFFLFILLLIWLHKFIFLQRFWIKFWNWNESLIIDFHAICMWGFGLDDKEKSYQAFGHLFPAFFFTGRVITEKRSNNEACTNRTKKAENKLAIAWKLPNLTIAHKPQERKSYFSYSCIGLETVTN